MVKYFMYQKNVQQEQYKNVVQEKAVFGYKENALEETLIKNTQIYMQRSQNALLSIKAWDSEKIYLFALKNLYRLNHLR